MFFRILYIHTRWRVLQYLIAPLTSEIYWSKIVLWMPFVLTTLINFLCPCLGPANFTFVCICPFAKTTYILYTSNNCDMHTYKYKYYTNYEDFPWKLAIAKINYIIKQFTGFSCVCIACHCFLPIFW